MSSAIYDVDWNRIKADFVGGMSYSNLAKKYKVKKSTIYYHGSHEKWMEARAKTAAAVERRTIEETAKAAASNAAKLEKAKGLAIDRLIKALEDMPEDAGSFLREWLRKDGKKYCVEYDLLALITALEKMVRTDSASQQKEEVTIVWGR